MYFPFLWQFCVSPCFVVHYFESGKVGCMLLLSYRCIVTMNVLWFFLTVPWVGLQYVIVVFSDHTHLLFQLQKLIFDC